MNGEPVIDVRGLTKQGYVLNIRTNEADGSMRLFSVPIRRLADGCAMPKAHLTANTVNWGVYYRMKVRQALEGKWKAEDTKWGMKEGMIELAALNPAIPADVLKLFNEKKAAILAGSFHPFQGVVKDQTGKVKVAAGQVISEAELWGMKWYIEGVEGALP